MTQHSTEFKSLEEMTEEELQSERAQHWSIVKSDSLWWIYRNGSPFMPVKTEAVAKGMLHRYGIRYGWIDRRQPELTERDWREFRRDKIRLLNGRGPSLVRRVWRWFGGDAA